MENESEKNRELEAERLFGQFKEILKILRELKLQTTDLTLEEFKRKQRDRLSKEIILVKDGANGIRLTFLNGQIVVFFTNGFDSEKPDHKYFEHKRIIREKLLEKGITVR